MATNDLFPLRMRAAKVRALGAGERRLLNTHITSDPYFGDNIKLSCTLIAYTDYNTQLQQT